MHVPRIFIDCPLDLGDVFAVEGPKAHHLSHVLKMRASDPLIVFNGRGGEYRCIVTANTKQTLEARVQHHDRVDRESALHICLLIAVLKKDPMRRALERATELGVSEILPVWTQHLSDKKGQKHQRDEAWQTIVEGASEQSGRTRVPKLCKPQPFYDALTRIQGETFDLSVIAHLDPQRPNLTEGFTNPVERVALAIGPEGGFSSSEIASAHSAGFLPFSMGPRILRAETAPAALLAYLQTRFGDFSIGESLEDPTSNQ